MPDNTANRQPDHPELFDPDEFYISMLILGAVTAAAEVFAAYAEIRANAREAKSQINSRKAAVHRWEAELFELRDVLAELRTFLGQTGSLERVSGRPIRPFASRILFEERDFKTCKKILGKLAQKTHRLHDTTFKLVEYLDSGRYQAYLSDGIRTAEAQLERLYRMESLNDSLDAADESVTSLLRMAEYFRNDLIS